MFAGLVVLWFVDGKIKKEQAFHALVSTLIAWSIADMIKNLFPIVRPFELTGIIPLTATIPLDGSFPSGHSAASWAMATTVWLHDKRIGYLFFLEAFGVSLGRVLSGVHYPIDVIVGIIIGFSVSYLFERLHLYKILSGKKG